MEQAASAPPRRHAPAARTKPCTATAREALLKTRSSELGARAINVLKVNVRATGLRRRILSRAILARVENGPRIRVLAPELSSVNGRRKSISLPGSRSFEDAPDSEVFTMKYSPSMMFSIG